MTELKPYTNPKLGQYGFAQATSISDEAFSDAQNSYLKNWAKNPDTLPADQKRYVFTAMDFSNSELENLPLDSFLNRDHGKTAKNPFSRLQHTFSNRIWDLYTKHPNMELRADTSSRVGLIFADAIREVQHYVGVTEYEKNVKAGNQAYLDQYNAFMKPAVDANDQKSINLRREAWLYQRGMDHLRFVAYEPLDHKDQPDNRFGFDDLRLREYHDRALTYASDIKFASDDVKTYSDPAKKRYLLAHFDEDLVNGADTVVGIGNNDTLSGMVSEMTDGSLSSYATKDFHFDDLTSSKENQTTGTSQSNATAQTSTTPTASNQQTPVNPNPKVEYQSNGLRAPRTLFFKPSLVPYAQIKFNKFEMNGQEQSRYAWRNNDVSDDSPVSVPELVSALNLSFSNKSHAMQLQQVVKATMSSTIVPSEIKKGKIVPKSGGYEVDMVDQEINGQHYPLSPSDLAASQAILRVLKAAHIDYSIVPNNSSHSIEVKVNNRSHTRITLLDPKHPYLVGSVVTNGNVQYQPSLGQIGMHDPNYSQANLALFSHYELSYSKENADLKDVNDADLFDYNNQISSQPMFTSSGKSYSFTGVRTEDAGYVGKNNKKRSSSRTSHEGLQGAFLKPAQEAELNNYRYAALDQATKLKLATVAMVQSLGIESKVLPGDMTQYKKDASGNTIYDPKTNQPVENDKDWFVFDDDNVKMQTVDMIKGKGYRRRYSVTTPVAGHFNSVSVIEPDESKTDVDSGTMVPKQPRQFTDLQGESMVFDFSHAVVGTDLSIDTDYLKAARYNPYQIDNPTLAVNEAYRNARINYYKSLIADNADDDKKLAKAQADFKQNLSDSGTSSYVAGVDFKNLKKKSRPQLPLKVQDFILDQFEDGILNASYDGHGVDDTILTQNRKAIQEYASKDDALNASEKLVLRSRMTQAYDRLVGQMNDKFGTAPLVNNLNVNPNRDLTFDQFGDKYASRIAYNSDKDVLTKRFNEDRKAMHDLFVQNIKLMPTAKDVVEEHYDALFNQLTFAGQRQLLDSIPHDLDTEDGQLHAPDHEVALQKFDQLSDKLFADTNSMNTLNLPNVINQTTQNVNSLDYMGKMAQAARKSVYETQIVGDSDAASLQVQERSVTYDPSTGKSIQELQAEDNDPESLNFKLHAYLDQVRGFKYVDANGNRVLDAHRDDEGVTRVEIPEDQRKHFSFDPADGNPLPAAFAPEGTRGDKYDPESIHLLNDLSPNGFKAQRLQAVKDMLEKSGAKVNDQDIKIDDNGVIHYDTKLPLYQKVGNSDEPNSTGERYLSYEEYQTGDYGTVDPDVVNIDGLAVNKKTRLIMKGEPHKRDYYDEATGKQHWKKLPQGPHYQTISGDIGQVFPEGFNGFIQTGYQRADGTDRMAGQRTYVGSHDAWFLSPEQDVYGNWLKDPLIQEAKDGTEGYDRLRVQTYGQLLDQRIRQTLNEQLATSDMGNVSKASDLVKLNDIARSQLATVELPDDLKYEKSSFVHQSRIAEMRNRLKFDDATGDATGTNSEIDKMVQTEKLYDSDPSYYNNYRKFVSQLDPNDPQRVTKIQKFLTDQSYDLIVRQHHSFDAYGGANIAETGRPAAEPYVGDANGGQSRANGQVQYLTEGTQVLPSGRVLGAFIRYETDKYDEKGNLIHHKGERVRDLQTGHFLPQKKGTPIDNIDANNMAPKNAADREMVAKDQSLKGPYRIDDAKLATMSLGAFTMEDAMVVSEDFARKYLVSDLQDEDGNPILDPKTGQPLKRPLKIGDKISDNGGNKATIAAIIPNIPSDPEARDKLYQRLDDEHLLDVATLFEQQKQAGHPIDVVMGPMSQISRNNGATTATYLASHDARFVLQHEVDGQDVDTVDENGQPVLLTYDQALALNGTNPDAKFALYENVGNSDKSTTYQKAKTVDQHNFAHPIIVDHDQIQHMAEENEPMSFVRKVKDENGNYVPRMVEKDGKMVPDVVQTGATLNTGRLTITDQLINHKVTRYDHAGSPKGRKMSFLVNMSDLGKGARNISNYHLGNGNNLRQFRAALLGLGTDLDDQTRPVAMDQKRYDALVNETGALSYQVTDEDLQTALYGEDGFDKYSPGYSNDPERLAPDNGSRRPLARNFLDKDPHGNLLFGSKAYNMLSITDQRHLQSVEDDRYDVKVRKYPDNYYDDSKGYSVASLDHNPKFLMEKDDQGSYKAYGKDGKLTEESQKFINRIAQGFNGSGVLVSNADQAIGSKYDAGSDFLHQIAGGGVLYLPKDVQVMDYNGNLTNQLYILPEDMRKNMSSETGGAIMSDLNLNYQRLGVALGKYRMLDKYMEDNHMMQNDAQRKEVHQYLAQITGLQSPVTSINKELDRRFLGGTKTKDGFFKNDVLGGYGGKNSVTSQLSANPALPLNVIEISPEIAKTLGFVPNTDPADGYAHMQTKEHGQVIDHKDWDHVHVHRDPVWREQGSLGFKVKIHENHSTKDHVDVSDLTSVRLNPVMASLMDGDFDGDNVGLIPMPGDELQHELKTNASVDRWMMDNNGNNSLLNMDEDTTDNADRVNPTYIGSDQDGNPVEFNLKDPKDAAKRNQVFAGLDPRVLSDDQNAAFEIGADGKRKIKDEYFVRDTKGNLTDQLNDQFPIQAVGDIVSTMTDSEIKKRYSQADENEKVASFIEASKFTDASLGRDKISITVPGRTKDGQQNDQAPTRVLDGSFNDPVFRDKLMHRMDKDVVAAGGPYQVDADKHVQISNDDLLKLMIKNQAKVDPHFKTDVKPLLTSLDADASNDNKDRLVADLHQDSAQHYQDARQKVDEIVQRSFGYDTRRNEKTGEVETKAGAVSNLTTDGVNYDYEATCFKSLKRYADIKAKGKLSKIEGLMGKPVEFKDKDGKTVTQLKGGYVHNPTHEEIALAALNVLNPDSDTIDPEMLDRFKKLNALHQDKQRPVQRALKIKTDMTGNPGLIQKQLMAIMVDGNKDDKHAAFAVGQAGTQKVLGIKREPVEAGYIAEMITNPVKEALSGKLPESGPLFSMLGNTSEGQLGANATEVATRVGILKKMNKPGTSQSLVKLADHIEDPSAFSTQDMIKIGQQVGIDLKPKVDPKTQAISDSDQIKNFRTTVSRGVQPYVRESFIKKFNKENPGVSLYHEDDHGNKNLTRDGFVGVMNYLYNEKKYGMELGVDPKNFERIADVLSRNDHEQPDKRNRTITPINKLIQGEGDMAASLMSQLAEDGYGSLRTQIYDAKQKVVKAKESAEKTNQEFHAEDVKNDSLPLMGREYSSIRYNYFGGLNNDELQQTMRLDNHKDGLESNFQQVMKAEKTVDDQHVYGLQRDEVHPDNRRRLSDVIVNSDTAQKWDVKDDQKLIIQQSNGGRLAVNVKVDDQVQQPVTMSGKLLDHLAGDHFTIKNPTDTSAQDRLTKFTDTVMANEKSLSDYQRTEAPEREQNVQDAALEVRGKKLMDSISKAQAKKMREEAAQIKEAVYANGSNDYDYVKDDRQMLSSVDTKIDQNDYSAANHYDEASLEAQQNALRQESLDAYDQSVTPSDVQSASSQPDKSVADSTVAETPASNATQTEEHSAAVGDTGKGERHYHFSNSIVVGKLSSLHATLVPTTSDTVNDVKSDVSTVQGQETVTPEPKDVKNDTPKPKPIVNDKPADQGNDGHKRPAGANRLVTMLRGNDWNPTDGGSTLNIELVNRYYEKAQQNENYQPNKFVQMTHKLLNDNDRGSYDKSAAKFLFAHLATDYNEQTHKQLANRADTYVFMRDGYLKRMQNSSNYANDLKQIQAERTMRQRQKLTLREGAINAAINAYDKQFLKKNQQKVNAKSKDHAKGPDAHDDGFDK